MAQTPWQMAAVGSEFSEQRALFAWAAMAASFGDFAADGLNAYTDAGYAKTLAEGGFSKPIPELKWLHAIKNQGHGDKVRGNRSKSEGVRAGVSDILLPSPTSFVEYDSTPWPPLAGGFQSESIMGTLTHHYCGLYIELKKPSELTKRNGGASDIQLEFQADMRAAGYACEIAHGWEPARDLLLTYLGRSS